MREEFVLLYDEFEVEDGKKSVRVSLTVGMKTKC